MHLNYFRIAFFDFQNEKRDLFIVFEKTSLSLWYLQVTNHSAASFSSLGFDCS